MNQNAETAALGRDDRLRINALADEFERAITAGLSPRIEDFLNRLGDGLRLAAFRVLLKVEGELRRSRQEPVTIDEYLLRFSGFEQVVFDVVNHSNSVVPTRVFKQKSKPSTDEAGTISFLHSDTGREFAVRCPHCHAPASIWVEGDLAAMKCPECGSQFSLISDLDTGQNGARVESVGHFELIEKRGSGAFGTVWKARDTKLDRTVAIKIPRHGSMTARSRKNSTAKPARRLNCATRTSSASMKWAAMAIPCTS